MCGKGGSSGTGIPIRNRVLQCLLFAGGKIIFAQDEEDASHKMKNLTQEYETGTLTFS
jgi:hypothetical protein